MDLDVFLLQVLPTTSFALRHIEHPVVPAPAPLTRNVRVVDRRGDADRCRGPTEQGAHVVRYAVEKVRRVLEFSGQLVLLEIFEYLVHEDEVVCWAGGPGEGGM